MLQKCNDFFVDIFSWIDIITLLKNEIERECYE